MSALDLFQYTEINNKSSKAIFLLHGTGGSDTDLLPLVEPFHKTHTIVGLLGNIREHGMARFFERSASGELDQTSIKTESAKLAEFITGWSKKNMIETENITFVGYSNGSNMILATLFYYPILIKKAALLHAMLPFEPSTGLDLSRHSLFFSWSKSDGMIPASQSISLIEMLKKLKATISVLETDFGHSITEKEVRNLHSFI